MRDVQVADIINLAMLVLVAIDAPDSFAALGFEFFALVVPDCLVLDVGSVPVVAPDYHSLQFFLLF